MNVSPGGWSKVLGKRPEKTPLTQGLWGGGWTPGWTAEVPSQRHPVPQRQSRAATPDTVSGCAADVAASRPPSCQ